MRIIQNLDLIADFDSGMSLLDLAVKYDEKIHDVVSCIQRSNRTVKKDYSLYPVIVRRYIEGCGRDEIAERYRVTKWLVTSITRRCGLNPLNPTGESLLGIYSGDIIRSPDTEWMFEEFERLHVLPE